MLNKMIVSAFAVAAAATPAFAMASDSAEAVVEAANNDIQSYLSDGTLDATEAEQLLEYINVEEIGRFALGSAARSASDAELAAYQDAFRGYLAEQLQTHLSDMAGVSFEIEDTVERREDDVVVETTAKGDGSEDLEDVSWRLKNDNGSWKVIDIQAMDLWLAIEQRSQFEAKLDENGGDISALTASL